MTNWLRVVVWMAVLVMSGPAGCAGGQGQSGTGVESHQATHTVILVSIDGCRWDYLDRGLTPTLSALAEGGVRAASLKPSMPTLTFPNHYTIVTGLHPDHHGVVGNTMRDARRPGEVFSLGNDVAAADGFWWDEAEPIWVTAEKAGLRTATMFWPGTEAEIRGVRPSAWFKYDKKVTSEQRVDVVLRWLEEPEVSRPRLITLYFDAVDSAGHKSGPDGEGMPAALREVDDAMARLAGGLDARGLRGSTDLVIVSDHGMAALSAERIVYLDDYVDASAIQIESGGVFTMVRPVPGREAEAAKLLGEHPHLNCWRKEDFPARFAFGSNPRVPPIGCLADNGWSIAMHTDRDRSVRGGTHGFDNDAPDMGGILIVNGPDFVRGGSLPEVLAVDVHPLLLRLLGISGPAGDGEFARVAPAMRAARE